MDCFSFWGDSKHLKVLFKSSDTITSLSSAGGLRSLFCIFRRPRISRQQHSWRLNEKKKNPSPHCLFRHSISEHATPSSLGAALFPRGDTQDLHSHTYCYDAVTKHKHAHGKYTPLRPISPDALLAPLQEGCLVMLEWGGGEGGGNTCQRRAESCFPHCLRLPVTNAHISHLLLPPPQPPPPGLFACAFIPAPANMCACAYLCMKRAQRGFTSEAHVSVCKVHPQFSRDDALGEPWMLYYVESDRVQSFFYVIFSLLFKFGM